MVDNIINNEDIEKLKEAAFAAAELLKSLPYHGSFHGEDRAEIIASIEAFKPEPVEFWANVYQDGCCVGYAKKGTALTEVSPKHVRSAVHLREVMPAPGWVRWKAGEIGGFQAVAEGNGKIISTAPAPNCKLIADAHNAEMKRVTGTEGE